MKYVYALAAAGLLIAPAGMGVAGEPGKVTEAPKVMPDGEPVICKRIAETGSLVKKTKRCYTKAQWDRIAEAAKTRAHRLQSDHASGLVSN